MGGGCGGTLWSVNEARVRVLVFERYYDWEMVRALRILKTDQERNGRREGDAADTSVAESGSQFIVFLPRIKVPQPELCLNCLFYIKIYLINNIYIYIYNIIINEYYLLSTNCSHTSIVE